MKNRNLMNTISPAVLLLLLGAACAPIAKEESPSASPEASALVERSMTEVRDELAAFIEAEYRSRIKKLTVTPDEGTLAKLQPASMYFAEYVADAWSRSQDQVSIQGFKDSLVSSLDKYVANTENLGTSLTGLLDCAQPVVRNELSNFVADRHSPYTQVGIGLSGGGALAYGIGLIAQSAQTDDVVAAMKRFYKDLGVEIADDVAKAQYKGLLAAHPEVRKMILEMRAGKANAELAKGLIARVAQEIETAFGAGKAQVLTEGAENLDAFAPKVADAASRSSITSAGRVVGGLGKGLRVAGITAVGFGVIDLVAIVADTNVWTPRHVSTMVLGSDGKLHVRQREHNPRY